jgi:hypothetical protein
MDVDSVAKSGRAARKDFCSAAMKVSISALDPDPQSAKER